MVYPEPSRVTANQVAWMRSYLNQFEQTLYVADWLTRTGPNHYSSYIDVDSLVDYHWITEFTKNINGYRLGNYLHKDRDGRLKMEPLWDTLQDEAWGLSFGNANYLEGGKTNGWYYTNLNESDHPWLRRLINGTSTVPGPGGDPDFNQRIADRWSVLRTNILNGSNVLQRVGQLGAALNEAAGREFARFPRLGVWVWPNPDGPPAWDVDYKRPPNYAGILAEKKKFIAGRFHWIDSQFTPAPTISPPGGQVLNGTQVTLTAVPGAMIYYTVDGTDPRAPGGDVAPGVLSNNDSVAFTVTGNLCLIARARSQNAWQNTWSGPGKAAFHTTAAPLRLEPLPGRDAGAFRFRLVGSPGPVTVQTSTDLLRWADWLSVTLGCAPREFLDEGAGSATQRFYRVTSP